MAYLGFYFGGGGGGRVKKILGKVGVFAWLCIVLHASRVRGYAPTRKSKKMVQFGAFWRIFC